MRSSIMRKPTECMEKKLGAGTPATGYIYMISLELAGTASQAY